MENEKNDPLSDFSFMFSMTNRYGGSAPLQAWNSLFSKMRHFWFELGLVQHGVSLHCCFKRCIREFHTILWEKLYMQQCCTDECWVKENRSLAWFRMRSHTCKRYIISLKLQ